MYTMFHFLPHPVNCRSVDSTLYIVSLPAKHLNMVFQAITMSRLFYAIPSWGCYLSAELSGKIDAFLRRAHPLWICSKYSNGIGAI